MTYDKRKSDSSIYDEPMPDDGAIEKIFKEAGEPPRSGDSELYPNLTSSPDFPPQVVPKNAFRETAHSLRKKGG